MGAKGDRAPARGAASSAVADLVGALGDDGGDNPIAQLLPMGAVGLVSEQGGRGGAGSPASGRGTRSSCSSRGRVEESPAWPGVQISTSGQPARRRALGPWCSAHRGSARPRDQRFSRAARHRCPPILAIQSSPLCGPPCARTPPMWGGWVFVPCWWARTMVEYTDTANPGAPQRQRRSGPGWHPVPGAVGVKRWWRFYTVCHCPNRSDGRYRHAQPVRYRYTIPSTTCRGSGTGDPAGRPTTATTAHPARTPDH